jgi:hypothetical protein
MKPCCPVDQTVYFAVQATAQIWDTHISIIIFLHQFYYITKWMNLVCLIEQAFCLLNIAIFPSIGIVINCVANFVEHT